MDHTLDYRLPVVGLGLLPGERGPVLYETMRDTPVMTDICYVSTYVLICL